MAIAEKNYKKSEEIQMDGDIEDAQNMHSCIYTQVAKMLKTLLTEKIEEDAEGFLVSKGNHDGIRRYAEISRHMMELAGIGLNDKMTSILKPAQAKSDADVMRCVEIWEDEYNDAILRGAPNWRTLFQIAILRSFIATVKIIKKRS
jgi:hypothetical protein